MSKKLVRLTEGDLHKIIKESVNKVLTELDWKTYQSAAEKSYDKAYDEKFDDVFEFDNELNRSERFGNAAEKAFMNKYPNDETGIYHSYDAMGYQSPICKYGEGGEYEFLSNDPMNASIPQNRRNMSDGERDVRQFAKGVAKYNKGKGWTSPRKPLKGFKN